MSEKNFFKSKNQKIEKKNEIFFPQFFFTAEFGHFLSTKNLGRVFGYNIDIIL